MKISSETKISELIKYNPACIDAIAGINRHFKKLKNPLLRKVMASRVTLGDAAKIGEVGIEEFFLVLEPLGFDCGSKLTKKKEEVIELPPFFILNLENEKITVLDVRECISSQTDPFLKIMETLKKIPQENVLLLINLFEPIPLITLLKKKGYQSFVKRKEINLFYTYFKKSSHEQKKEIKEQENIYYCSTEEFNTAALTFGNALITIDVCELEMPLPMVKILEEIEKMEIGQGLYVHHKKIPQYLLSELEDRKFRILINERGESEVKLLIYK